MNRERDCAGTQDVLYLLEDELEGLEGARLSAHLDRCEECFVAREEFLAARGRLLAEEVPSLPDSVEIRLPLRRPAGLRPRFALATAAALLLVAAAWMDLPRMGSDRGNTLAVRRYRFPNGARVQVIDERCIPRTRTAAAPDQSWSLVREPGEETVALVRTPESSLTACEVGVGERAPACPPRWGRVESGQWKMADLVVRTRLTPDGEPPADALGWKTR